MKLGNSTQGTLDGLCGVYAVVNALKVGCGRGEEDELFITSCKALSRHRWPTVLWSGTGFGDMQRMIKGCIAGAGFHDVVVSYPFTRNRPSSNSEYWERLDDIFADDHVRCAIMGVTDPMMHWIVAGLEGRRVQFLDSTVGQPFKRKNQSSLIAGSEKVKSSQWLLNPREVIIFSVVN